MSGETPAPARQGLLDTSILVLRHWIDPAELPDEMAISAITLAELSAGPHQVRPNTEQDLYDEHEERGRRTEALQRAESEFDLIYPGLSGWHAVAYIAGNALVLQPLVRVHTALRVGSSTLAHDEPMRLYAFVCHLLQVGHTGSRNPPTTAPGTTDHPRSGSRTHLPQHDQLKLSGIGAWHAKGRESSVPR